MSQAHLLTEGIGLDASRRKSYLLPCHFKKAPNIRIAMQETALGVLPSFMQLQAAVYQSLGSVAWERSRRGPAAVRDALAPALEPGNPAGSMEGEHETRLDQLFVELVANALAATGCPQFLHYVLGTFLPFALKG